MSTFLYVFILIGSSLISDRAHSQAKNHSESENSQQNTMSHSEQPSKPLAVEKIESLRQQELAEKKIEDSLVANTLVFWSLSRGEIPSPSLVKSAGLSSKTISSFRKNLKKSELLDSKLIESLRKDYQPSLLTNRIKARKRFLKFTAAYQKAIPGFGANLPEILTVWGEARNLAGFTIEDSLYLQAKMASVIHVLRNRESFFCRRKNQRICQSKTSGEIKFGLATKRFQFSAFEPYDANLAELAFGPSQSKKIESLDSLPELDKRSLLILARTIQRLDQNRIQLSIPIGNSNTRHYLTPTLVEYSVEAETNLRKMTSKDPRRTIIRIPTLKPRFLSTVPKWTTPDGLITDPKILVQKPESSEWSTQEIPPKDFIYFQGLL
jgi:hypothetical protein